MISLPAISRTLAPEASMSSLHQGKLASTLDRSKYFSTE